MKPRGRRLLAVAAIAVVVAALVVAAAPSVGATDARASARHAVSRLLGVVPAWARAARPAAAEPAAAPVDVAVALRTRHAAELSRLVAAVSDPASAGYRHFLTPAQYRARFAPSVAAADLARGWLAARGLTVEAVSPNRTLLYARGAAATVSHAFGTTFGRFRVAGQLLRAPLSVPSVPASLRAVVSGVTGLTETAMHPSAGPAPAFVNARPCSSYFGQKIAKRQPKYDGRHQAYAVCGYTPRQIRSAYGMGPTSLQVGAHRLTGKGTTVAIVDAYASPSIVSDVNTYSHRHQLPRLTAGQLTQQTLGPLSNPPEVNVAGLGVLDPQGWAGEEALDVEAVHTIAPQANIQYVAAPTVFSPGLDIGLAQAIEGGKAQVVSDSWGSGDDHPLGPDKLIFDQLTQEAAAEGITVDFSSGDDGDEVTTNGFRSADYPATSDLVTAVGGTTLVIGRDGRRVKETYWGTSKDLLVHGKWDVRHPVFNGAGGGGVSTSYAEPTWQRGVVPQRLAMEGVHSAGRVEPDVSMVADSTTGFLIGQTTKPANGPARYGEYRIGGTSVSCPLFSGLVALAVQLHHGDGLGLITPMLYKDAATTKGRRALFNDPMNVKTRHGQSLLANVRPDFADPSNPSTSVRYTLRTLGNLGTLHALSGYDDSTGLGTPKSAALVRALG